MTNDSPMTSPAPLEPLRIPLSALRKIYKEARKRRNFYAVGVRDVFRWWVQHEKDRRMIRWLEAERAASAQREAVLRQQRDELIEAVKWAYRKHHLEDESIGWDELSDKLLDTLSNAMGIEELVKWQEGNGDG